jgi:ABC-2 type transport system ATP-binding protein
LLDIKQEPTTRLQIHVADAYIAETELLRLMMADEATIVTEFVRSSHNLEDVFVNLVAEGGQNG